MLPRPEEPVQCPDLREDQATGPGLRAPLPALHHALQFTTNNSNSEPSTLRKHILCARSTLETKPWTASLTVQTHRSTTPLRRLRSKLLGLPRVGVGGREGAAAEAVQGVSVQGTGGRRSLQGAGGLGAGCWGTRCRVLVERHE